MLVHVKTYIQGREPVRSLFRLPEEVSGLLENLIADGYRVQYTGSYKQYTYYQLVDDDKNLPNILIETCNS